MKQLKMHRDKERSQIMREGDRDSKKGKRLEEEKKQKHKKDEHEEGDEAKWTQIEIDSLFEEGW